MSHSSKNKFIRSFFGRIHGLTICFRNYLTFRSKVHTNLSQIRTGSDRVSNEVASFNCIKWEKFRSTKDFIHKHIFWLKRIMPYDAIIITSNFRFLLHKPENEKIDTNYLSLQSKKSF